MRLFAAVLAVLVANPSLCLGSSQSRAALPVPPVAGAPVDLAAAIENAVVVLGPDATAHQALAAVGLRPGDLTPGSVAEAFAGKIGPARLAELRARLERSRTLDPKLGELAIRAMDGEQVAGPVLAGALIIAALVALAGCASTPSYETPRFSTSRGWDMIGPEMSNAQCRELAASKGYGRARLTWSGCWGAWRSDL